MRMMPGLQTARQMQAATQSAGSDATWSHASLELMNAGCRQAGRRQVYKDDAGSADDEAEAGSKYSEQGSDAERAPQDSQLPAARHRRRQSGTSPHEPANGSPAQVSFDAASMQPAVDSSGGAQRLSNGRWPDEGPSDWADLEQEVPPSLCQPEQVSCGLHSQFLFMSMSDAPG